MADDGTPVKLNSAHRKPSPRPRKLLRSAGVLLALLFVLLRPVCETFAAPGHEHAVAVSEQGAVQSAAPGDGHADGEFCCASVDAQSLTVPASTPLPAMSSDVLAAPSSAVLQTSIPPALPMNLVAQRDPAPPLRYHARSLRRLD